MSLKQYVDSFKLPALPEVGIALVRTLNQPDVDAIEIARYIKKDPVLVAQLLRQANSAQFGLSRQVESIGDAIKLIGLEPLRAMAFLYCTSTNFKLVHPALSLEQFWAYSLRAAILAKKISFEVGEIQTRAWLCAMLMRIGELLIADKSPELMFTIEDAPTRLGERWLREKELLGFDECQVTAVLAAHWKFPLDIVEGLRLAADPCSAKESTRLSYVIHLAGLLADATEVTEESIIQVPDLVLSKLNLTHEKLVKCLLG